MTETGHWTSRLAVAVGMQIADEDKATITTQGLASALLILDDLRDPRPCSLDVTRNCLQHDWYGDGECPQHRLAVLISWASLIGR